MQDDASLVAAYIQGDTQAFEELYQRYFDQVFGAVYMRTHHTQTTEEIVSTTWMKVVEKLHTFSPKKGSFGAWIHRIARNLVIDHYRSLHPSISIEDVWDLADDTDVERDVDTVVQLAQLRTHMKQLKPKQRDIILLRIWYQYSFAEIANILGTTEAACKMSYKRSLEALQALCILFLIFSSLFHVIN